jgi:hypothetical protein
MLNLTHDQIESFELILHALTLAGGLFVAFWAYYTYKDTKKREFYTEYWNKKFSLFLETSEAASRMATTQSLEEFKKVRAKFWELFYGRLSLVEGDRVKHAMEDFAGKIPLGEPEELPLKALQDPAYVLTQELKTELSTSWKKPFSELRQGT